MLADRGYYNGEELLACEGAGVLPYVPKTHTSGNSKRGLFTVQDFIMALSARLTSSAMDRTVSSNIVVALMRAAPPRLLQAHAANSLRLFGDGGFQSACARTAPYRRRRRCDGGV